VIDVQAEWAKVTGGPPVLPQAGLAVTEAFLAGHAPLVERLHAALAAATEAVLKAPAVAAGHSAAAFELPLPVIERAIPNSRLVATRARDARIDLERMFATIAEGDLAVIGGRLPGDPFYL
jgi:NitT/TauT family transport system substrate-binding protein